VTVFSAVSVSPSCKIFMFHYTLYVGVKAQLPSNTLTFKSIISLILQEQKGYFKPQATYLGSPHEPV